MVFFIFALRFFVAGLVFGRLIQIKYFGSNESVKLIDGLSGVCVNKPILYRNNSEEFSGLDLSLFGSTYS